MSTIERALIRAGGVLIRAGKHKLYELRGERFALSHGARSRDGNTEKRLLSRLRRLVGQPLDGG